MSKIQFDDKVQVQERPEFSDNQKVNASDMNEIKNVVNENDENAVYKDGIKTINGQSILGEGNLIITGEGGDTLPIGSMLPYGNVNPPANWLVCDGSAVSRTTYADLFSIIGTTYGEGDGSTTFNLPNKKGRVSAGYDATNSQFNALGKHIGEEKHTMTIEELVSHNHITEYQGNYGQADAFHGVATNSGADGGDVRTKTTGGSQPFNVIQPTEVDQWIIKAFQSAGVIANVAQAETDSNTDTYSCNYVNNILAKSLSDLLKFEVHARNVTQIAETYDYWGLGEYTVPEGYKVLGILSNGGGFTSWQTSFMLIENIVYACIKSWDAETKTADVSCTIVFIKDSTQNSNIVNN